MMSPFFETVVPVSHQWRCCGVTDHRDWYAALHDNVVPDRCCQRFFQGCGRNSSNSFWTRVSLTSLCETSLNRSVQIRSAVWWRLDVDARNNSRICSS